MARRRQKREVEESDVVFRVVAYEHFETTGENEEDGDRGTTDISVEFSEAIICSKDAPGGFDHHHVFTKRYVGEDDYVPWDYRGDRIYLVVARYETGDTFGRTTGKWAVHAGLPTFAEAEAYASEHRKRIVKAHDDYFGGLSYIDIIGVSFRNEC